MRKLRTLLLALLILTGLGWLAWRWLEASEPAILTIPRVAPGNDLVIHGANFGDRQGEGRVERLMADGRSEALSILAWSDGEITARLPDQAEGAVQVTQNWLFGLRSSEQRAYTVEAPGLPSAPYGYEVPVQADAPWPTFRRDQRNTGFSPLVGEYTGDRPWAFSTAKGIFSTPIIDAQGMIYVGSADHFFYALNPDGTLDWKFETGEIIDSAGALGRIEPQTGAAPVTFISGDGKMYHFRTGDGPLSAAERQIWTFEAELLPEISYNRWFEGNVAMGYNGTLYAGNTNFNYYAINPDGTLKWTYSTGANNWSQAGFGEDGSIFWGSLDTYVRAVSPGGDELWRRMTLGFIAASAAVGSDGTAYIGSFDSNLYALDPLSGAVRWKFPTGDHIYSSAALDADEQEQTTAIYFGSADGQFYALRPDGSLLWRYDTGDPIRSSPAIGRSAEGGKVIYFGAGNGRLYALNAADGSLRWAFDTTPEEAELRDRNDLNGSPALGKTGVTIGGEHGQVWYVPYDYCLHQEDEHCIDEQGDTQDEGVELYYVTPGGSTQAEFPAELPAATQITLRLVVREGGDTVDARLCNTPKLLFGLIGCPQDALEVTADPAFPLQVEHSADGKYIYIRPEGFLEPGQSYRLSVKGRYDTGGMRLGNLRLGGEPAGRFEKQFAFQAAAAELPTLPLESGEQQVGALEWTRLAVPLPPMLPSLNQIGFDYIDWIIGVAAVEPQTASSGKLVLWAIGARRDEQGRLVADPESDFTLPLNGVYQNDAFILSNQDFTMQVTGIPISFNVFQLRGQLGADGVVKPGASVWADTAALSIPTFGPYLVVAGLANNIYEKLLVAGTYITRAYAGPANRRPQGIEVEQVDFKAPTRAEDGTVRATFKLAPGAVYPAGEHRPGILLVDATTMEAIYLDYHGGLSSQADADGNLRSVELRLPAGTVLPAALRAYVLLDVFPLATQELQSKQQ